MVTHYTTPIGAKYVLLCVCTRVPGMSNATIIWKDTNKFHSSLSRGVTIRAVGHEGHHFILIHRSGVCCGTICHSTHLSRGTGILLYKGAVKDYKSYVTFPMLSCIQDVMKHICKQHSMYSKKIYNLMPMTVLCAHTQTIHSWKMAT